MNNQSGSRIPLSIVTTNTAMIIGIRPTITLWIRSGILWLGEKTITNENRYKERGTTQSNGTGAMSVVINDVTPSIRLEGTNVSPIHRSRRKSVGDPVVGPRPGAGSAVCGEPPPLGGSPAKGSISSARSAAEAGAERHSITAEANTKATNNP